MSPVNRHRKQPFNCGCVVFHRGLTECWWNEQTFLVAVRGLKDEGPSSVCDITVPGMLLVLAVTVYLLHDIEGH